MVGGDYCGRNEGLPLHNAEDNPMPVWMQMKPHQQKMPEKNEMDIVEQFKQNPDAFFPDFMKANH